MERELKIVLSVFLAYFIYALTTYLNSGSFLAPFFMTKLVLAVVAIVIAAINLRVKTSLPGSGNQLIDHPDKKAFITPKAAILSIYAIIMVLFALTDDLTIQLLDYWTKNTAFDRIGSSTIFLVCSFVLYLGFLVFSVILFYRSLHQSIITGVLFLLLSGFVLSFFWDLTVLRAISLHLFFILFFVFGQRDSDLKNKALRVIAYQYLLCTLLQSFEYFI